MDEYASLQAWRRVREAFVRQAALVRRADAELGSLILLSNSNNFYFICLQVFNGAGGEDGMSLNKVYYLTSVAWLCARACAVVLAAAEVNVRSRTALGFIYEYPDRSYNVEVQRLEKQLTKDVVALSGKGFFYLNRGILLEVGNVLGII
ncbi:unnamed protein product [Plutella xylostella]|uniref:(diamondback moth) hypothetical protein n=1 Tax=Plutella xylostella TaxID=51655 RepID=A0A8S4E708_PLUXY|nr:unnamed protein product [Plutella xylostella]